MSYTNIHFPNRNQDLHQSMKPQEISQLKHVGALREVLFQG
jgi:hypothetical protein